MTNQIDVHVGARIRRRRRLLGLTQSELAGSIGVRFQQIQKYECGDNRVTAARLYELARKLKVPLQYFFEGLAVSDGKTNVSPLVQEKEAALNEVINEKESLILIRAYSKLNARARRQLIELAHSLGQKRI